MRHDNKADAVGVILMCIMVVSAVSRAYAGPQVEVVTKNCYDPCHKDCAAQGENMAACEAKCSKCDIQVQDATVVVQVVIQGGTVTGAKSESGSSDNKVEQKATPVPVQATPAKKETPVPAQAAPAKKETPVPAQAAPAKKETPVPAQAAPAKKETPVPAQAAPAQKARAQSGTTSATGDTTIKALCQGAMYKDACQQVLSKVANGSGTTQDVIKAGAVVALQGITKMFNQTDTLLLKVNETKKPESAKMAVNICKDLFDDSIEKLQNAINEMGKSDAYNKPCLANSLRLWLSDVVTYSDNCMESLGEAEASGFQDSMKDGVVNATQVTISILDVFTSFTKALNSVGYDLNTDKIVNSLKNMAGGSGRRLLGDTNEVNVDDRYGSSEWLSHDERKFLDTSMESNKARSLDGLVPNAVVALDGSGQFTKIMDAVNAYDPKAPLPPGGKYIIYVKAGIYDEFVLIDKKSVNIYMYGDGPLKTIVTGKRNNAIAGIPTISTSSFAVQAKGFFCRDMGFENTAGPEGHQAVALRANGEEQVFLNCEFNGYQDTLYAQGGSQFFRDCTVRGTVDFIFGGGATIFQHCNIIVRMPMIGQSNAVTACGRKADSMPTGIVLHDCIISADPLLNPAQVKSYLGRPWKEFARTVFMESDIGGFIVPEGFEIMAPNEPNSENSYWGEFANKGDGSKTDLRVKWPHVKVISKEEAHKFTVGAFLPGGDVWVKAAGVPYTLDFVNP